MKLFSKYWKVLVLAILSGACTPSKTQKPVDVLPPDSMAMIIAEIHYADAILITAENQRKIKTDQIPEYYAFLLRKMNISKERFDSSLVYYSRNMNELAKIYDEALQILQKKQGEINAGF